MKLHTLLLAAFAAIGSANTVMPVYDTIIVGMGAAGCGAASLLCKAGKKVLGLEAQNRIGGRVNTVPFGDGLVELGAEWIHGERPSVVYDLAIQNNVSILSQDTTFQVYRSDGSMADHDIVNDLVEFTLNKVDDPPKDPEPLGQFLTREIKQYINQNHPNLNNDQDFIEQFLRFMDLIIDNYESSNSWNDVTTQSAFEDLEGDLHLSWHKHGYKTLFDILLNKYNNGPGFPTLDIQLEKVVTKISYPNDPKEDVTVTCKDGTTYRAKNVIVTVSLGVLKESQATLFSPSLPQSKISSIDNISIGVIGKIILLFPYSWLGNNKSDAYNFLWTGNDKKGLEGDWSTDIIGVTRPKTLSTVLTVWTCGETTRLQKQKKYVAVGIRIVWKSVSSNFKISYNALHPLNLGDVDDVISYTKLFTPQLPSKKIDSINQISFGAAGKIIFNFDHVWWGSIEDFAFLWRGEDREKVAFEDRWIFTIDGFSVPMGSKTSLTLWTVADGTKLVETLPDEVVKRKSMELLRRFLGKNGTIPEPIAMLRSNWYSNPYTRGSYTYDNLQTPLHPQVRSILAEPLTDSSGAPRVLFAGEGTNSIHFSTVHGALETGYREAHRLLPKGKL